jgi:membrane-associated protein
MFINYQDITFWLVHYKYWVLFPLIIVEGPIITVITGFFASLGYINIFWSFIIIVFGDISGDYIYYLIGRVGGVKFIKRWGKYFKVQEKQIQTLKKQFDKKGGKILISGKILHGIGGTFLIAAGIVKMPLKKFFSYNFIGSLIKSFILLVIGFYFGKAVPLIGDYLGRVALISFGIVLGGILFYFLYYRPRNSAPTKS